MRKTLRLFNEVEFARVRAQQADGDGGGTTIGTPAGQSGITKDFTVLATTTNNVNSPAIDTGYTPPPGHTAKLDGGYSVTDRANHVVHSGNLAAILRNYGGLAVAGSTVAGSIGDGSVIGATPVVLGVSGGGTLTVTFEPNAAYVGTLEWQLTFSATEN